MKNKKTPRNKNKKKKIAPIPNNNWEYSLHYRLARLAFEDSNIKTDGMHF